MFLVFNLPNCSFCSKAIQLLKDQNFKFTQYNVEINEENKQKVKNLIKHLIIISQPNKNSKIFVSITDTKKYLLAFKHNDQKLLSEIKDKIDNSDITFPQIFICDDNIVEEIMNYQFVISEEIKYIGGCDDIFKFIGQC